MHVHCPGPSPVSVGAACKGQECDAGFYSGHRYLWGAGVVSHLAGWTKPWSHPPPAFV